MYTIVYYICMYTYIYIYICIPFGKFYKTCWPIFQKLFTIAWSTWSTNRIKKVCFVTSNLWHTLKISKYFVLFSCIFNLLERNHFFKECLADWSQLQRGLFTNSQIGKSCWNFHPLGTSCFVGFKHSANKGN